MDTGYKILVNDKIIITRHVKFIENDERYITVNDDSDIEDEETRDNTDERRKETADKVDEEAESGKVPNITRPKRDIKLPKEYEDHVVYVNFSNATVPESYEEAMNCVDSGKWKEAMKQELKSLEGNKTWSLVDEPIGKNIIEVKWIYRVVRR
ncbi:hypothetical protein Trydic_g22896 [Trypoxylus dichotomus]